MAEDKSKKQNPGKLTIDELSALLQKNVLSTSVADQENMATEKSEPVIYNQVDKIFAHTWEKVLNPNTDWYAYSANHPVVLLQNESQSNVKDSLEFCLRNDLLDDIWALGMNAIEHRLEDASLQSYSAHEVLNSEYEGVEQFDAAADELLTDMMSLWQVAQSVPQIAEVCNDYPAFEDFDSEKRSRASIDHYRKWYHTQTKVGYMHSADVVLNADPEAERAMERVINNVSYVQLRESFCATLNDLDKKIFCLRERGYSQTEIARILGFESQGTVSKRLRKLKEKFKEFINSI